MNNRIASDSAGSQLNRMCPIEDASPFQKRLEKHKPAVNSILHKDDSSSTAST